LTVLEAFSPLNIFFLGLFLAERSLLGKAEESREVFAIAFYIVSFRARIKPKAPFGFFF
jgi:hypothetical protein